MLAVLAVGADMLSLDMLMLSVLSFSSSSSERRIDMEKIYMGRLLAGTAPPYSSTRNYNRNLTESTSYLFNPRQTVGRTNIQLEALSVV